MTAAARRPPLQPYPVRAGAGDCACSYLSRLTLTAFRSYRQARIEAAPGPVVIAGANGAGKTNLLEAISLLTPGRGLRGAKLPDLQQIGSPPDQSWGIAAEIAGPDGGVAIGTGCEAGGDKRTVLIDGKPVKSQAVLAQHLAVVWLTPQMDGLFLDSARARRKFLDRLVFGLDPAHAGRVSRHEAAIRQRARILAERPGERLWLDALEAELAATGVALAAARLDLVGRLTGALAQAGAPFPRPSIAAGGPIEDRLAELPALAVEDWLKETLARNRLSDAAQGETAVGAHRSDLIVYHAEKSMPAALSSTGEQKALLAGIVLAVARLGAAESGRPPVLLLDEVAAHFDDARRGALLEEIVALGGQAWLTGAEASLFDALGDRAQRFSVLDGRLVPG